MEGSNLISATAWSHSRRTCSSRRPAVCSPSLTCTTNNSCRVERGGRAPPRSSDAESSRCLSRVTRRQSQSHVQGAGMARSRCRGCDLSVQGTREARAYDHGGAQSQEARDGTAGRDFAFGEGHGRCETSAGGNASLQGITQTRLTDELELYWGGSKCKATRVCFWLFVSFFKISFMGMGHYWSWRAQVIQGGPPIEYESTYVDRPRTYPCVYPQVRDSIL